MKTFVPSSPELCKALETVSLGIRSTLADLVGTRNDMPADKQAVLFRALVDVRRELNKLFELEAVDVYGLL